MINFNQADYKAKFLVKKVFGKYLSKYNNSKKLLESLKEYKESLKIGEFDKKTDKRLLITSSIQYDPIEGIYAKVFKQNGFEPYLLAGYNPYVKDIAKIYGIAKVYYYEDFFGSLSFKKLQKEVDSLLCEKDSQVFFNLQKNGVNIGKFAVASLMRLTRESSFDLNDAKIKVLFEKQLFSSLQAAYGAQNIINELKPDLLLVNDRGYTPVGQLFDIALSRNISIISRNSSHKSGWEIIKKYNNVLMDKIHPCSLSKESWQSIKNIPYSEKIWDSVYNELKKSYLSGDWFAEVGTQFNKKYFSKQEIIDTLKLDPNKKTAVIFAHMFWDATFSFGKDIFRDYYDWFVNVLKAAGENKNVNWIVKIHPANVVKAKRDNYKGEHKELQAIYDTFGKIPEHIKVISPEHPINTFSLFELMDYCVTVRGTIGIEASAFGINTLTAGTGRYDRLGFTHDFDNKDKYLEQIRHIENIPKMSKEMVELARKFAYGILILRPINLDLIDYGFQKDETGSIQFKPLFNNEKEFNSFTFVKNLKEFVNSSNQDFLNKLN